ncbi:MAG: hypothetical protein Q9227_003462 [Pyrenula ochraceoflavens]
MSVRTQSQSSSGEQDNYEYLAQEATKREHDLTLFRAIKRYPKAVCWSLLLSTAIVMEGFQLILMEQMFAYPAFQKSFGTELPDGTFQLPAIWQTALLNGASVGSILGLWANGWLAERYGNKKTMLGALMLITVLIAIPFFAVSPIMLLVGQVLMGIPWGIFQTLTVSYAAEVSPTHLRAYLTTYINMCWLFGQIIASGLLQGLVTRAQGEWAYRLPFALEWLWPVPLIVGIAFAPESPWWLVRKQRIHDAKKALRRLTNAGPELDLDVEMAVALMIVTIKAEKDSGTGTRYRDCLTGVSRRRTAIACAVSSMQTLSGAGLGAYSTYFYEQAGLTTDGAFTMTIGQYGVGIVGVLLTWSILDRFGRRTIYLSGLALMACCLILVGFLGLPPATQPLSWAIGSCFMAYQFILNTTVGSICWSLVSEIPSNRLRNKTVVLARVAYYIITILSNVVTPFMLNPSALNWGAKAGFFWGALCALSLLYSFFQVPEPKGKTFGELDILFQRKVPARLFASTVVQEANKAPSVSTFSSEDSWVESLKPVHSFEKMSIEAEVADDFHVQEPRSFVGLSSEKTDAPQIQMRVPSPSLRFAQPASPALTTRTIIGALNETQSPEASPKNPVFNTTNRLGEQSIKEGVERMVHERRR